MLNLKKGLALVLAAATAFTFAPVSTLSAYADTHVTTDGLTTTPNIDSKPANVTLAADATSSADGTRSDSVWLQEHEGKSSNNTLVKAYRITIQKHKNKNNTYFDAVKLYTESSAGTNSATSTDWSNVTTTAASAGTASTDSFLSYKQNYLSESVYIVPALAQSSDKDGLTALGGAYVKFAQAKLAGTGYVSTEDYSGSYTVTVEGLGAFNENDTALDKSTFTVTIPKAGEALNIKTQSYIVAESSELTIPYTISNKSASDHFVITTDNSSVAYLKATGSVSDSYETHPTGTDDEWTLASPSATGTFKIYAGEAGVANIKVADHKSNHDEINSVTIQIKVTPKNGKLYVTYETTQGTYTFNDDAAFDSRTVSANATQIARKSITEAMGNNGVFTDSVTNDYNQDGLVDGTSDTSVTSTNASSVQYTFVTKHNDGFVVNGGAVLPAAKTLYADGTKTVQITGSSDAGAEVSYALVAPDTYYTTKTDGTTDTTGTKIADNDLSKVTGDTNKYAKDNSGSAQNVSSSTFGGASKIVFTETAAREYGSIDKNGLVTLKDAKNAPTLYVIVTAKKADAVDGVSAERATSTFIVPVGLATQQPVNLYVSDSKFFAEASVGNTDSVAQDIHNTLYLSLTDRKTDTLAHKSNVSDNYITVTSSDPSVVSVNGWTLTAQKEGSATITVKTSSAPEVSGIANVKINVCRLSSKIDPLFHLKLIHL